MGPFAGERYANRCVALYLSPVFPSSRGKLKSSAFSYPCANWILISGFLSEMGRQTPVDDGVLRSTFSLVYHNQTLLYYFTEESLYVHASWRDVWT